MGRKLFCEISPLTYRISSCKESLLRDIRELFSNKRFVRDRSQKPLPFLIYAHQSVIRRRLTGVDQKLQSNKAVNLSLAAPKIDGILIRPGETFSFWRLVGSLTAKKGYQPGLTITAGRPTRGIGGGMCQFSNLLHWLVLHSDLTITEHHHHNGLDLFPDDGRQVPFGSGTSILHKRLDYQFKNNTEHTYQLLVAVNEDTLCGELRCDAPPVYSYDIFSDDEHFTCEDGVYYRNNRILRRVTRLSDEKMIRTEVLLTNHAKVMYNKSYIASDKIRIE